jgi:uncharacterized protein (TIGR02231 family)
MANAATNLDTYGFTTTFQLPTPRTIPSTPLVRRHVIAEIALPKLFFTHIVIPKLKAAAFLKSKLTNTSTVPLLPGQAGLTLDGSFMGSLSFPRCSPEETVELELGIDQGMKVEYERPTKKHGTQGMILIGKEEVGTFNRSTRITNTKGGSVSLVVLDQVPVPENDKLRVTILAPKGLRAEGDSVRNGVGTDGKAPINKGKTPGTTSHLDDIPETASIKGSIRNSLIKKGGASAPQAPAPPTASTSTSTASGSKWGTAKAALRKNGEVRWDVDLYKGGCVSLGLEWECRVPSGDWVYALS